MEIRITRLSRANVILRNVLIFAFVVMPSSVYVASLTAIIRFPVLDLFGIQLVSPPLIVMGDGFRVDWFQNSIALISCLVVIVRAIPNDAKVWVSKSVLESRPIFAAIFTIIVNSVLILLDYVAFAAENSGGTIPFTGSIPIPSLSFVALGISTALLLLNLNLRAMVSSQQIQGQTE